MCGFRPSIFLHSISQVQCHALPTNSALNTTTVWVSLGFQSTAGQRLETRPVPIDVALRTEVRESVLDFAFRARSGLGNVEVPRYLCALSYFTARRPAQAENARAMQLALEHLPNFVVPTVQVDATIEADVISFEVSFSDARTSGLQHLLHVHTDKPCGFGPSYFDNSDAEHFECEVRRRFNTEGIVLQNIEGRSRSSQVCLRFDTLSDAGTHIFFTAVAHTRFVPQLAQNRILQQACAECVKMLSAPIAETATQTLAFAAATLDSQALRATN